MSCTSPLIAFPKKGLSANGKVQYVPLRKATKEDIDLYFCKDSFVFDKNEAYKPKLLPCGHCIGCRLDYSKEWACRCMLELKSHEYAWFLTLTYGDNEVPKHYYPDPETGEALVSYSLEKRHWQLFMKRLRQEFADQKLKFFMAGEYGSKTMRPHYHAIVFGLNLDDKKFYKQTDSGMLYNSERVNKCWQRYDEDLKVNFPRGYVVIGEVNWQTCAYVARYTAKKEMALDNEFFEKFNMEPPFVLMSRRPAIGREYFDQNPDLFDKTELHFPKQDGIISTGIPKYFFRLLEQKDPGAAEEYKKFRGYINSINTKSIIDSSSSEYSKILEDKEKYILARSRALVREI